MASATATTLDMTDERRRATELGGYAGPAMLVGVILLAVAAGLGYSSDSTVRFWHAYLFGTGYIATLSIGALFFVMAHHLTGGRWGTTLRRPAEIVSRSIWVPAVLFVPILVMLLMGNSDLYPWNNAELVAADPLLSGKTPYLNAPFFVGRTVFFFVVFWLLARFFAKGSLKTDETGDVATLRKLQKWSGPSMMLFAMTLNFASFDWFMTLDPVWFSTIFGVYIFAGSVVSFVSLLILMSFLFQRAGILEKSITVEHYHDLGKLLFGFIFFWGYIAFSQFLLIWYANVPEETGWYAVRQSSNSLIAMSLLLLIGHLLVPFLGTMSAGVRRNKVLLTGWAVWMLLMHAWDLFYIIMPTTMPWGLEYGSEGTMIPLGLGEVLCLAGAIALFFGAVARGMTGKWLVPVRDPRIVESLTYVNH